MKKVAKVLFDEEQECPVFVLEDGTKLLPYYSVGGQGVILEWLTQEEIDERKKKNNASQ